MGCVDNCRLAVSGTTSILGAGANALVLVTMTETGSNTGVFESFDTNGNGQFETIAEASADSKVVFAMVETVLT